MGRKQVAAMMKSAMKQSKSTKELMDVAKEGVNNIDKAEEMHAAKEEMEAEVPSPQKITEEKVQETTQKTIEGQISKVTEAVAAKVSSPEEKLAIREAMKGVMAKAVNTAANQVSENVAKQVVFHHKYTKNGTLLDTKMETPEDEKAMEHANTVATQEAVKAKEMEAEKQKLQDEANAENADPGKAIEEKSEADKAEEKAEIARQVVKDIQKTESNPEDDTPAKLEVTKTKAKVKVIGREAHRATEKAKDEMREAKVEERFSKKMTKHMKEVAHESAKMVKENAEKKEEI